jgi:hypothetical protein
VGETTVRSVPYLVMPAVSPLILLVLAFAAAAAAVAVAGDARRAPSRGHGTQRVALGPRAGAAEHLDLASVLPAHGDDKGLRPCSRLFRLT